MTRIAVPLIAALLVLTQASGAGAADKIRVVATIPDLADMTRHVGGDLVGGHQSRHRRGGHPRRPDEAELRPPPEPRRRGGAARPGGGARVPSRAARGGAQSEDPARRAGLHRLLGLRESARCPQPDRPLARRPAPDGQPAHQSRSGARQGHGARHRRRSQPPLSGARIGLQGEPGRLHRAARHEHRALGTRGGAPQGEEAGQLPPRPAVLRRSLRNDCRPERSRSAPASTRRPGTSPSSRTSCAGSMWTSSSASSNIPRTWRRRWRVRPGRSSSSCPAWWAAYPRPRTTSASSTTISGRC